jgi:hypothetical protein
VLSGDAAVEALYSNPAARIVMPTGEAGAETEVAFWSALKARRMKINLGAMDASPGLHQVRFEAESCLARRAKRKRYGSSTDNSGAGGSGAS